ncbi:MAG: pirin family protein [Acidimicrobiia bacterium]
MSDRRIRGVYRGDRRHWVGDGFYVTNVFPANDLGAAISPFLLMDYHAPYEYGPTDRPRGVGSHPHRGFETVTLAFEGRVAHHDSTGGGGVIGPGDAQWMTAASGILHKEYHEQSWARQGGRMHMMQLWVNLPAVHKMDAPRYQPLLAADMGHVELPDGAGTVRVIAGEYLGATGPAKTHTHINLWEARLEPGGRADMAFPASENAAVFVLDGDATVNGATATATELVLTANDGEHVAVTTDDGAHLLVLGGEPIDETVVSWGPFVMNTAQEIREAVDDFNAGRFGYLE